MKTLTQLIDEILAIIRDEIEHNNEKINETRKEIERIKQ